MTELGSRPKLAPHVRLSFDQTRQRHVLQSPEAITVLNDTGAAVLGLCDGQRTVADIVAELQRQYDHVAEDEVRHFLDRLVASRCVQVSHG